MLKSHHVKYWMCTCNWLAKSISRHFIHFFFSIKFSLYEKKNYPCLHLLYYFSFKSLGLYQPLKCIQCVRHCRRTEELFKNGQRLLLWKTLFAFLKHWKSARLSYIWFWIFIFEFTFKLLDVHVSSDAVDTHSLALQLFFVWQL